MKLFAQIAPFIEGTCKYNIIAGDGLSRQAGFSRQVSEDIDFDGDKVFTYPQDSTDFADTEMQVKLENGVTREEWMQMFPDGVAVLELVPNAETEERNTNGQSTWWYYFWKGIWEKELLA